MRYHYLFTLLAIVGSVFGGCHNDRVVALPVVTTQPSRVLPPFPDTNASQFFLAGVYVFYTENSYCEICDTLSIRRIKPESDYYRLTHSVHLQIDVTGKAIAPTTYTTTWVARWVGSRLLGSEGWPDLKVDGRNATCEMERRIYTKIE